MDRHSSRGEDRLDRSGAFKRVRIAGVSVGTRRGKNVDCGDDFLGIGFAKWICALR